MARSPFYRSNIFGLCLILSLAFGLFVAGCGKASAPQPQVGNTEKPVSYWTCGMHPSVHVTDAEYKKGKKNCPICGMNLIPAAAQAKEAEPAVPASSRNVYYGCGIKEEGHCPHCDEGKPDAKCICGGHSVMIEGVSMKCPACGKPLKELTADEARAADKSIVSRVKLNKEMEENAGVAVEAVKRYHVSKTVRTVGRIAFDPELAVSEEEFLTALETRVKVSNSKDGDVIKRADDLVAKSRIRLKLLGLNDEEIKNLEKTKEAQTSLILPEDKAWVYADIYEYDLGWVKEGQEAKITAVAFPGEEFRGEIRSIAPTLDPKTRSVKARIEVSNPDRKLKPDMYVDVMIESMYTAPDGSHEVLAVPKEAILDTGTRKIVYVQAREGEYLGKEVVLGPEGTALDAEGKEIRLSPILSGLKEGEVFVRRGNFLIDSQSQLTGGMSAMWSGAQEIKGKSAEPQAEDAPVETKHRH